MRIYKVSPLTTGFFSGTLDPRKLETFLNQHAAEGWKFVRSIHEQKKVLFFFKREAHFVVFEKEMSEARPSQLTPAMAAVPTRAAVPRQPNREGGFLIAKNGQELGRKSVAEISEMLLSGNLALTDHFFDETGGAWSEIRSIPGLAL